MKVFDALVFMWEFPQNLVGLATFWILKMQRKLVKVQKENYRYFIETQSTGVSLGWFVFWTPDGNRFPYLENDCRMHEYGHALQSSMLGPLYLLVVGVPSLSRVIYRRAYRKVKGRSWKKYYNGFPENWADKLGGIRDPQRSDIRSEYV